MDERGDRSSPPPSAPRGRLWIPASVCAVLFLAMALWNTSLLDAGARISNRLEFLEHTIDSLERVQSNQLARERLLAAEIARLRALEEDVQAKADAATVWTLRTRVDTLTTQAARLQSEVRSAPGAAEAPSLP